MGLSKIEWTDYTFNPWWGCCKVSDGCKLCYAETFSHRLGIDVWGPAATTDRRTFGESHWAQPLAWQATAERTGQRARVFCASMADVFEDHPTAAAERPKLWELIEKTPMLTWLLLTKRPENMRRFAPWPGWWPKHVVAMTSVENQEQANIRIPILYDVPARRRGLSMEPMLGPVDLGDFLMCRACGGEGRIPATYAGKSRYLRIVKPSHACPVCAGRCFDPMFDWVIVGGESGHGARPMAPAWVRRIHEECSVTGVPFFFKQWGEYNELGERVGKGKAGRLLDGVEYSEFPGRKA